MVKEHKSGAACDDPQLMTISYGQIHFRKQWYFTTPIGCVCQNFSSGGKTIFNAFQWELYVSMYFKTPAALNIYLAFFPVRRELKKKLLVKHSAHLHYLSVQSQWRRDGTNATPTNHHILLILRLNNKRKDSFSPNSLYQINSPTTTKIGMKNNTSITIPLQCFLNIFFSFFPPFVCLFQYLFKHLIRQCRGALQNISDWSICAGVL